MTLLADAWVCAVPEVSREVPLVELRILGGLNLRGAGGRELSSVLAQPKRVALLAYLAAATPRRLHRRDSLLALFWPELDQEHARAALRQALHGLRHALGDGVLVTRGDEDIGLDAERIRCDVVEFARAAEVGRLADALDLYRGDLLEGFFIRGAPEFEQWLEDERARLKAVALRSATQLAERTEGHGDLAEAAQWSRRALRIAPLDEPALRRLMKTLDRLGDRAGALEAYETFAKRLTAELEADPAPETRALAGAVRERVATLSSDPQLPPLARWGWEAGPVLPIDSIGQATRRPMCGRCRWRAGRASPYRALCTAATIALSSMRRSPTKCVGESCTASSRCWGVPRSRVRRSRCSGSASWPCSPRRSTCDCATCPSRVSRRATTRTSRSRPVSRSSTAAARHPPHCRTSNAPPPWTRRTRCR